MVTLIHVKKSLLSTNKAVTITDIGNTGSNNGGHSKFTVELQLPRAQQILSGLEDGATYYYAYYDTLFISNIPSMGGGSFFGR